jgi:hypothetical protein
MQKSEREHDEDENPHDRAGERKAFEQHMRRQPNQDKEAKEDHKGIAGGRISHNRQISHVDPPTPGKSPRPDLAVSASFIIHLLGVRPAVESSRGSPSVVNRMQTLGRDPDRPSHSCHRAGARKTARLNW